MSTIAQPQPAPPLKTAPQPAGLLASFRSAVDVTEATRTVREAGYRRLEVYSPYPLHGIDQILQARKPLLPFAALLGGAAGIGGGLWMAWWMNAVDYPFIISGKPLFSILPSLPVAFELAVLLAAFAVFGGAILLGGMPRHSNRLFSVPAFARVTDDRFFLAVDGADKTFEADSLTALLRRAGALQVDEIPPDEPGSRKIPRPLIMASVILATLALIPPVLIMKARATTSVQPRISLISDMDHQPKYKAQTFNPLFADGRAMRPQVAGTIARGDLRADPALYRGVTSDQPLRSADDSATEDQTDSTDPSSAMQAWVRQIPVPVNETMIRRGQERFNIYCATCHGIGGDGDGLVTLRALELEQGTWVRPASLHSEAVRDQPAGQLFNTISNGIRKMPGYSSQIAVDDRWAIVAYLRALQRTRTGTIQDVPQDIVPTLRELN